MIYGFSLRANYSGIFTKDQLVILKGIIFLLKFLLSKATFGELEGSDGFSLGRLRELFSAIESIHVFSNQDDS